jgi:type II secretory pathway component PulK
MERSERGEGVISAAIAVLIMAFLGAAMWVGFNSIWGDAEDNIDKQVTEIGGESGGPIELGE